MSGRKKRRQRILAVKILLLAVFIGGFAAMFAYAWKLSEQEEQMAEPTGPLVCIDAGHGGTDAGAVSSGGRCEKDDNLKLALIVEQELKKRNIKVMMTREEDVEVSLRSRCDIANDNNAVLFVSIHRNSAASSSANGVEIWTASKGSGTQLAEYIFAQLEETGIQTNRGIQSGTSSSENSDYYVNRNTVMPSCLVEMGFITNEKDNRLLDAHMEDYGVAIAEGISRMLAQME